MRVPGAGSRHSVEEKRVIKRSDQVILPNQPRFCPAPRALEDKHKQDTCSTILDLTLEVLPHELDGVGRRWRADGVQVDESQLLQLGSQAPVGLILTVIDILEVLEWTVFRMRSLAYIFRAKSVVQ